MSLSVHAMTTEPFIHMLGNLSNILGQAAAHAEAKKSNRACSKVCASRRTCSRSRGRSC
jgi:hypothetical protein